LCILRLFSETPLGNAYIKIISFQGIYNAVEHKQILGNRTEKTLRPPGMWP
jgi:hypothetical protein